MFCPGEKLGYINFFAIVFQSYLEKRRSNGHTFCPITPLLNEWRIERCVSCKSQDRWKICGFRPAIVSRRYRVIVPGSTVSGSTIGTESVFGGLLRARLTSRSSITISEVILVGELMEPVSPGELLKEEFLEPMGLSQYRLAKETGIPAQRIGRIVLGRRRITADTDLRLCRFFGLSDGYWLRAQAAYDLEATRRNIGPALDRIIPWEGAAVVQ